MIELFRFFNKKKGELYLFPVKKYGISFEGWIYDGTDDGWVLDEGWSTDEDFLEVISEGFPKTHQLVGRIFNSKDHTISV